MIRVASHYLPRTELQGAAAVFHGFTESASQIRQFSSFDSIADTCGLEVYYLDSDIPWNYRAPLWRNPQLCEVCSLCKGLSVTRLAGFSAGAYMVAAILQCLPNWFTAAVMYAGAYKYRGEPANKIKTKCMLIRNEEDELVTADLQVGLDKMLSARASVLPMTWVEDCPIPNFGQPSLDFAAKLGHWWKPGANIEIERFFGYAQSLSR